MIRLLKALFNPRAWKQVFKKKTKFPKLLDSRHRVAEAFIFKGVRYFQFDNAFELPVGRAMSAITFYEEFRMRCTHEYLEKHIKAVDAIIGDPKKINIPALALIHHNLKERLQLVPFPEHVYRLASVNYFTAEESPYAYDFQYNQKKIAVWKEDPDALHFFLTGPMSDLIPSLNMPKHDLQNFFHAMEEVDKLHRKDLRSHLSSKVSTNAMNN